VPGDGIGDERAETAQLVRREIEVGHAEKVSASARVTPLRRTRRSDSRTTGKRSEAEREDARSASS
jgi:hypothetical protein